MKTKLIQIAIILLFASFFQGCFEPQKVSYGLEGKTHSALTPANRNWLTWWTARHNQIIENNKTGNVDLLFVGDSITHGWQSDGEECWNKYYAPRNAVNMGYGGDRTEHVLWRLNNGEIDGINPKLAILMIGTNNCDGKYDTAEEIADGIKAICAKMCNKLPKTKILLLEIFPRGEKPSMLRDKIATASKLASKIADNKMIHYMSINDKFLTADGTLSKEIMYDFLHPSAKGYEIWAQAIEPKVKELMGEK